MFARSPRTVVSMLTRLDGWCTANMSGCAGGAASAVGRGSAGGADVNIVSPVHRGSPSRHTVAPGCRRNWQLAVNHAPTRRLLLGGEERGGEAPGGRDV